MKAETRTKTYLVNELRNHLAFMGEHVGPLDAKVEYLRDVPGGALITIHDPTLGPQMFEVRAVQRRRI